MSNGGAWIMMLGILLLLTIAAIAVFKYMNRVNLRNPASQVIPAAQILDERYARGEVSDEEYNRKKVVLRS
jgi:putative membrane protein